MSHNEWVEVAQRAGIPLDLLSIEQAAQIENISADAIREWIASGAIAAWGRVELGIERVSLSEVRAAVIERLDPNEPDECEPANELLN